MNPDKDQNNPPKKLSDEIAAALESCADALSLTEFSRITGVRIELLRRFINRKARYARAETWDKIYPTLKPYLLGPEPIQEPPPRIGPGYRRHAELVDMLSDQKILLDEFAVLDDAEQKQVVSDFVAAAGEAAEPTQFTSLTAAENRLMGAFLAMSPEVREQQLLKLTELATAVVVKARRELF